MSGRGRGRRPRPDNYYQINLPGSIGGQGQNITQTIGQGADQGSAPRLWPLDALANAVDFGVHEAIRSEGDAGDALPLLPPYVPRAHDAELHAAVKQAVASGESRLVIVQGGSSTGKSRSCWEALKVLPAEWKLWRPANAEDGAAHIDSVGPDTVVWLDDAYRVYLSGSHGEQFAAALYSRLMDVGRAPLLVLASMWPPSQEEMRPPGAERFSADARKDTRRLLFGGGRRTVVRVPDFFSEAELAAAEEVGDPRLARALSKADAEVTQYLAGAQALVAVYRQTDAESRALIDAAIDLARVGYGPDLPGSLLVAAAVGYLPRGESGHGLRAKLTSLDKTPIDTPGPLTAVGGSDGDAAYRLADYLEQYGTFERRFVPISKHLWEAVDRIRPPADRLFDVAYAAGSRGFLQYAFRFNDAAVEAGDTRGLSMGATQLIWSGRGPEALAWLRRHAAKTRSMDVYIAAHSAQIRLAAVTGLFNPFRLTWFLWAVYRAPAMRTPMLLTALFYIAQIAVASAMWLHAIPRPPVTDIRSWLIVVSAYALWFVCMTPVRRQIRRAVNQAKANLVRHPLWPTGIHADAVLAAHNAEQHADPTAVEFVARQLHGEGRYDEAVSWLVAIAESNPPGAPARAVAFDLAWWLGRTTDERWVEGFNAWIAELGEAGDPLARAWTGPHQENGRWLQARAEAGDFTALPHAIHYLNMQGRQAEALAWLRSLAARGDNALGLGNVYLHLGMLLAWSGDGEAALHDLETALAAGNPWGAIAIGSVLAARGEYGAALARFKQAAHAGQTLALAKAIELMRATGDESAAEALWRYGWQPETLEIAAPWTC